jgi:hypothetical protein
MSAYHGAQRNTAHKAPQLSLREAVCQGLTRLLASQLESDVYILPLRRSLPVQQ